MSAKDWKSSGHTYRSISRLKTPRIKPEEGGVRAIGHEIERNENDISKLEIMKLELMIEADKVKGRTRSGRFKARGQRRTAFARGETSNKIKSAGKAAENWPNERRRWRLKSTLLTRPVRAGVQP